MSIKNFNETIGNWTRDLPACSAAPQPTAPQRTPILRYRFSKFEEAVTGETHSSGLSHTVTYFVKLYVLFTKIMQTISRIRTAPYGMGTEVLRLGKSDGDVILIIHLQVEGKSEWSYTSSPLICLHSADRNTCTFTTRLTASNNVKSCKKIKWQKKKILNNLVVLLFEIGIQDLCVIRQWCWTLYNMRNVNVYKLCFEFCW